MMLGIPLYLYLRWRRQQQDRIAIRPELDRTLEVEVETDRKEKVPA